MLKSLWNHPTKKFQEILSNNIRWTVILSLFAVNGIYIMYYILRSEGLLDVSSNIKLIKSLTALILFGTIWGIISNLLIGFFIKITGRLFKVIGDLKNIYAAMAWASVPLIIGCTIIILNLIFAHIIVNESETTTLKIFLSFIIMILTITLSICAFWQLILLIKNLKVVQNLNLTKTILNYILATLIYSPIYYLLLVKY